MAVRQRWFGRMTLGRMVSMGPKMRRSSRVQWVVTLVVVESGRDRQLR